MSNAFHITEEELELIDQYLSNRLEGDALMDFEKRLATETAWQEKVAALRWISLGIQEASLEQKLEAFHREHATARIAPVQKISWKRWLVAASVIAFLAVSILLIVRKPENERLFAAYYKPDPGLPVVMGEENKDHYTLYDGMIDYKEGNYNKAIEKWKSIGDSGGYTDTLNYYIGIADMSAGNMEQAARYLGNVSEAAGSSYRQKAIWYLALIYIKQGNKAAAQDLLNKIKNLPEAKELLQLISG